MKSFASDNYAGVHPNVMDALIKANIDHQISYGDDIYTHQAREIFRSIFGEVDVFFTFNGTGANVVSLKCCTLPYQSVLCASTAHIHVDECGAPVQATGSVLTTIDTPDGKLTPELLKPYLSVLGNVHHTQPKVISISQSTELGTVYTIDELKTLTGFAHSNGLYVHMDGARISNAVASLGVGLKESTVDCGVDIMSFGGTKNGLMFGEAVLIFHPDLKKNAPYLHKQSAQLFSKNRFIAAQFVALLENDLWLQLALSANNRAQSLAAKIQNIPQVQISRPTDANAVFVILPREIIVKLQSRFRFYVWDDTLCECRWMCSYDTTEEEIEAFTQALRELL